MTNIQDLITMLQSDEPNKRFEACELLRVSKEKLSDAAIKALEIATKDNNSEVADAAQRALNLHLDTTVEKDMHRVEEETSSINWEYAEMEVTIGGPLSGIHASVYIYRSNGKHEEFRDKMGILFAKLGERGWELVASSARIDAGLSNKHKINYIFKRPIQRQQP